MKAIARIALLAALLFSPIVHAESISLSPPYTPGQIVGVPTNTAAAAGVVGEYMSATCSASALTTATGLNCNSLALTAGDWDVYFSASFTGNAATTFTYMVSSISLVSATINTTPGQFGEMATGAAMTFTAGALTPVVSAGPLRQLISGTTTVYGVCQAAFAVNTATCSGIIYARRVR